MSIYTRQMVLGLITLHLQDLQLAESEFWAFIMLMGGTLQATRQHYCAGEPVLLRLLEQTRDGWRATLLSPARFAPVGVFVGPAFPRVVGRR